MRVDYLRVWLQAANREDFPDPSQWEMAVGLIQASFREGRLDEGCSWKTAILIPKSNDDFCGIGLVEVIWKTVKWILNCRLTADIQFHDTLYRLQTGRGTGTAYLESNIPQQLLTMREEILYDILLDIHKSHDSLNCDLCLDILLEYVKVPWDLHLLWRHWDRPTMVARDRGYFGTPFKGYCGVTQGGALSTTIFNVVIYVVLQHWVTVVAEMEETADPIT